MCKKIHVFLVAAVLAVSLTGCGGQTGKRQDPLKEGKTTLVVGVNTTDGLLEPYIDEFNQTNETYYVELKSYSACEDSYQQLLLDISSGNAPDIIQFDDSLPMEPMIEKGVLEDLTPYFQEDGDLGLEDLLDNVVEAVTKDGKVYCTASGVGLCTLLAKTEDVGERTGWTEEEMLAFINSLSVGQKLFQLNSRSEILGKLALNSTGDYIDWETGTCRFDSEAFREILQTAGRGTDTDQPVEDVAYPQLLQTGEITFSELVNASIGDTVNECSIFNEAVTAVGYPSKDRNGSYFMLHNPMGICAGSGEKEGAWEFVKTFLSREYQYENWNMTQSIPTRKDVFDMALKSVQAKERYTDEMGNEVEPYTASYSYDVDGGNYSVDYGPLTEDQIGMFLDIFYNTHKIINRDEAVWKIVGEEAEEYFEGNKSVEDTVDVIQSRVSLYVNERR